MRTGEGDVIATSVICLRARTQFSHSFGEEAVFFSMAKNRGVKNQQENRIDRPG